MSNRSPAQHPPNNKNFWTPKTNIDTPILWWVFSKGDSVSICPFLIRYQFLKPFSVRVNRVNSVLPKKSPRHLAGTCDSPGCAQTCALPRPWFVHWKASHPSGSAVPTSVNEKNSRHHTAGGVPDMLQKKRRVTIGSMVNACFFP